MEIDVIYNMDCLEGMKTLPDGSIDMILCDLPYGTTRNKWDSIIPFDALWALYKRIIKDHGAIVLFGDGLFTAKLILSNVEMWRYNLIWDKQKGCDFLNANIKPMKSHEDICVFYKKKPIYHKQYWFSKPYKRTVSSKASTCYGDSYEWASESTDGRRNPLSILSFPKDSDLRVHPTQKPVPLLEYLIKTYTDEGAVILDNCMGSGSTCVAAVKTNRHYIGFETDERYFKIACKRLDEIEGSD